MINGNVVLDLGKATTSGHSIKGVFTDPRNSTAIHSAHLTLQFGVIKILEIYHAQ